MTVALLTVRRDGIDAYEISMRHEAEQLLYMWLNVVHHVVRLLHDHARLGLGPIGAPAVHALGLPVPALQADWQSSRDARHLIT